MKKKVLMSWSSGKDSAWALHALQQDPEFDVVGLFCTVNKEFDRVAMHGVRLELLQRQAKSLGLPLEVLAIPNPCSNAEYEEVMASFVNKAKANVIEYFAFGDLFLEDIRRYREDRLKDSGIKTLFPLWGIPTEQLARDMLAGGLRTMIACIDPKQIPKEFAGREFDSEFLDSLPASVDPCGENGEFHSFVFDGPMFNERIDIVPGDVVERDGFVFADILPKRA